MPSKCILYRPCFLRFSLQFQIVLNTVGMHHLPSLFLFFFSAFPNRFKCRQNAPFTVLVFKISRRVIIPSSVQKIQISFKSVKRQSLATLFSISSLHFQMASNSVRMHALENLFRKLSRIKINKNKRNGYNLG